MKIKLYLPFYDYNDSDFEINNDYYKSNEDYFNAVEQNLKQTRNAVMNGMSNYVNGGSLRGYQSTNGQVYAFGGKAQNTQEKVSYAECEAMLYNDNGKDESIDDFIKNYVSQNSQIYILNLNLDNCDEDFEQELNLWFKEHENLQKYGNERGNKWILDNEPVRQIKVKFTNNANEEKYAEFVNSKIIEKQGMNIYILLVQKINLIDKIQ